MVGSRVHLSGETKGGFDGRLGSVAVADPFDGLDRGLWSEGLVVVTDRPAVPVGGDGPVGVEAQKALVLFKQHLQREEEFILPPLTLLPHLADGKVSPDMKWAIAMADRVKAEREKTYHEHTQITDAMKVYERDVLHDVTWHP